MISIIKMLVLCVVLLLASSCFYQIDSENFLYGLDENRNGVRDEIDSYIMEYKDHNKKNIAIKVAQANQSMLENAFSRQGFEHAYADLTKIEKCASALNILSEGPNKSLIVVMTQIEDRTYDTFARKILRYLGYRNVTSAMKTRKSISFEKGLSNCGFKIFDLKQIVEKKKNKSKEIQRLNVNEIERILDQYGFK